MPLLRICRLDQISMKNSMRLSDGMRAFINGFGQPTGRMFQSYPGQHLGNLGAQLFSHKA